MDQNLPRLYKEYGQYSNYRNFPLDLDGLKPVERRVLLSAYKIANAKFVKSRQVDAYTIGHYHPHGECYGTIVQLVRQGFLDGQGNFGSTVGVEPIGAAAPRYTECKINKYSVDIAFKYLKYAQSVDTELGDKEPLFLPSMYPLCLLGKEYTQGIGFGFKTYIPCYTMQDLYKRLLWLVGERKTKPIIAPVSDCKILATDKDLDLLLTTGKAKIAIEGIMEVIPRTNTVILRSWPPGRRFESLLNAFAKDMDSGLIGFLDQSAMETQIVFEVLRERNRDKIFHAFVKKLKKAVQGSISFETTVIDVNQKVFVKSIDNMLLDTFKMFSSINENMLKDEIEKLEENIVEYNVLEKIRKPLTICIQDNLDIDKAIDAISKLTLVDEKIVKDLIDKYKIKKLLTLNTDTTELKEKKKIVEENLKNLSSFVLQQYSVTK